MAVIGIKTNKRTYLFEMAGSGSDISDALGKKSKAFNFFNNQSDAIEWAQAHGVPIKFMQVMSVKPPTLVAGMRDASPMAKRKVNPK